MKFHHFMVRYEYRLWIILTGILLMVIEGSAQDFVAVRDGRFIINDQVYTYVGANFWQGMHLGSLATGNRTKLVEELDHLHALGINNLRIMAASEGPQDAPWRVQPPLRSNKTDYNQDLLEGLDFLLDEMAGRRMKAVVCLGNFWPWTGGMAQLVSWSTQDPIPYPPPASGGSWIKYMLYTSKFYRDARARALYRSHLEKIIRRVNSISGIPYHSDPTIMAWQLANEPRGMIYSRAYRNWIKESAEFIKSIDRRHLVSIGSEGNTPSQLSGNRFAKDHQFADVDYMTVHVWIENWGWYDPEKAAQTYDRAKQKAISYLNDHLLISEQLNKPLVLEEFGIARDRGSFDPTTGTEWRDHFFRDVLEFVAQKASSTTMSGVNFWAWSGSSRPIRPGGFWGAGDPLLGDPPHEHQGWYGVYDSDVTTLAVVKHFADQIARGAH